jgi:hypothetical protein
MSQAPNTRVIYSSSKRARSNVEEETRLIENRIRMIKFEEERATKRILETREKIDELYKTRTRYLEDQHLKNIQIDKSEKELFELQENCRISKEFHQEKMNMTMIELFQVKNKQGKRVRAWKEHMKRKSYQQDLEKRRYNRKLKEAVLESSKQGNFRLQLLQDIKQKKAQFDYNKKVEQENFIRKQIEVVMDAKGQEEKAMMIRLANIHEIKKQAEEELRLFN